MFKRLHFVVRLWAVIDLVIAALLALPFTALQVIGFLFTVNDLLGGQGIALSDQPFYLFFVNLAGTSGVVWAISRFFFPNRPKAILDILARLGITGLIFYYVLLISAPASLFLLVIIYLLGAFHQLYAFFQRPVQATEVTEAETDVTTTDE